MEGPRDKKYGDDRGGGRQGGGMAEVREEAFILSCPSLRYSVFDAKVGSKLFLSLTLSH